MNFFFFKFGDNVVAFERNVQSLGLDLFFGSERNFADNNFTVFGLLHKDIKEAVSIFIELLAWLNLVH